MYIYHFSKYRCKKDILYKDCIYYYYSKHQKPHLVKKKSEENFFENFDSDKTLKQNVNNGLKYIAQKESIHKQKLFQNDKEQSKATQTQ